MIFGAVWGFKRNFGDYGRIRMGESLLCFYTRCILSLYPRKKARDPPATGLYQSLLTTPENWTNSSLLVLSLLPG
jgi:hypothetical protein